MAKSAATLGAEIVRRKGEATPSVPAPALAPTPTPSAPVVDTLAQAEAAAHPAAPVPTPVRATAPSAVPAPREAEIEVTGGSTKSMSVKIDYATYRKLKAHGLDIGKSSQDIFVQALALYFKANKL